MAGGAGGEGRTTQQEQREEGDGGGAYGADASRSGQWLGAVHFALPACRTFGPRGRGGRRTNCRFERICGPSAERHVSDRGGQPVLRAATRRDIGGAIPEG